MKPSLAMIVLAAACGNAPPPASSAPHHAVVLGPSDVTLIWPLPADVAQLDSMLAATSTGRYGELVPDAVYQLPVLDQRDTTTADGHADRARLHVVAARFEPCRGSFGSPDDPSCTNQLRLVFQVVRPGGGGAAASAMGANDGAVLAFYKLSREELLAFAGDLAALRDANGGGGMADTVGVNPLLARDGDGSAYAKALQAKILEHAGAGRLTRLTFFVRTKAREPLWSFGAFDVVNGAAAGRAIVTLGADHQTLEGAGPRKVITPATSSRDNPGALLAVFGAPRDASPDERAAYAAVLRIENPKKHTPETIACAECHASERMRATAEKMFGLHADAFASDAYATPLTSVTAGKIDAENFHAVSYLGENLAVTTRTVNDTSAVVAEMNALLAGR